MPSEYLKGYTPSIKTKYKFGDKIFKLAELKDFKPIFAYDFLSLEETNLCFNNPKIEIIDYIEILQRKKELSRLTYQQLKKAPKKQFHFHPVKLHKRNKKELKKLLTKIISENSETGNYDLPEIYQFAVYTNEKKAPRILGFIGELGVFYIILLDLDHTVNPIGKKKK